MWMIGFACLLPLFYFLVAVPILARMYSPSDFPMLDVFFRPAEWLYEAFPPYAVFLHWALG